MVEIGQYIVNLELISIVATPIISFIAIIIYARALKNSRQQNEVLLSQNIKPNFEKEIKGILEDGKNTGHIIKVSQQTSENKSFDHIHIFDALDYHMRRLINSGEFKIDRDQKKDLTEEYLQKRNYWNDLYWIRNIINRYSNSAIYYKTIENFLENLDNSRMIGEDKYSVKNHLRRQVLNKPLTTYRLFFMNLRLDELEIPIFTVEKHKLEWQKIANSQLFKSIEKIQEILSR